MDQQYHIIPPENGKGGKAPAHIHQLVLQVCVCCHVDASEKPSVHKTTKVYELMPECSLSLFYAISS